MSHVLYYGSDDPLPETRELRAGPLTMLYEAGDLRYIRLGDREVLRRVYVAVRDRNWGTVPAALSNVRMDVRRDSFTVTYDADHRQGDIHFQWTGAITGEPDGSVCFTMEGIARSTFLRNRIGFCVLHPIRECAGVRCTVEHPDGTVEEGAFPRCIAPHQPFVEMQAITHEVAPGLRAEVRFDGDIFEMEDQRNWSDASFKTYCTPLRIPYPVEVAAGTTVRQSVTLTLRGQLPALPAEPDDGSVTITLGSETTRLPKIGVGVASHGQPLTPREIERLRALNLTHLRVDLRLYESGYDHALRRTAGEASALGVPLEVALHLSDAAEAEFETLLRLLEEARPEVARWLIFHRGEKATSERWVRLARERLGAYQPGTVIGTGTDAEFVEINRRRPPVDAADVVCYSMNPQVHAFDNASLVETLEAQASTVESARQFIGGKPLAITPVTLKRRFNPDATGPEPEPAPGELPRQVDPRQMSLFGAVWTLGSLKYLAESGVESVTFYETTGWRGVMETEAGSPLPEKFPSLPGAVFPLYHVLAAAGEFAGGEVVRTVSNRPLAVDGLLLRKDGATQLMVANMGPEPRRVRVPGFDRRARIRYLDESATQQEHDHPGGDLELTLRPYAVAFIDA